MRIDRVTVIDRFTGPCGGTNIDGIANHSARTAKLTLIHLAPTMLGCTTV